nr:DUF3231 family protein [Neobacillus sp. Marseille-Q6967]
MTVQNIPLTTAEMSCLWSNYVADSMSICVLKYFLVNNEDTEIKQVVEHALDLSQQHVEIIRGIFTEENIPIPQGFTNDDVNLKAKRLFSDSFYLYYIKNMTKGGLAVNSVVIPNIYRADIRSFYSKVLTSIIELSEEVTQLLLEKGLATRPPQIPKPRQLEFIQKQSFLFDFIGNHRPLTGLEVTNLYANIQTNLLGEVIATAFAQVASSTKVREYMMKGKNIAKKHINVLGSYLEQIDLPVPMSHDHEITDETEAPFSDKLMMFHFNLMTYAGLGNYGVALSQSQKSDLITDYSRLQAETLAYSEDGANIMINEGWLEQPPMAVYRDKLAKEK